MALDIYKNWKGEDVAQDPKGIWRLAIGGKLQIGFATPPSVAAPSGHVDARIPQPQAPTETAAPAAAADPHSTELEKLFNRTAKLNALVEQLIDQGKNEGVDFQRLVQVNFRLHADVSRLLEDSTKLFNALEEHGKDSEEGKRDIFAQLNELSKAQDTLSKTIEELSRAEQEKATKQQEGQARLEEAIGNLAETVEDLRRPQPSREEQPAIEQETAMARSPLKLVAASVAATLIGVVLTYFAAPALLHYYWAPKGGQLTEQSRISREPPVMPVPPALTKQEFESAFTGFKTEVLKKADEMSGQVKTLETQVTTGLTTLTGQVNTLEQAHTALKAFVEQRDKQAAKEPSAQPAAPAASAPQADAQKAPEGEADKTMASGTPVPPVSEEETLRRVDHVREVCHKNGFHAIRISVAQQLASVKDLSEEAFKEYVKNLCHPGRDDPNPPAMKPKEQMVVRAPKCAEGEFDPRLSICVVRNR